MKLFNRISVCKGGFMTGQRVRFSPPETVKDVGRLPTFNLIHYFAVSLSVMMPATHPWNPLSFRRQPPMLLGLLVGVLSGLSSLAHAETSLERLKAMSLEDLANLEVSIVGKRSSSVLDSPAAVFVITAEDIRRSTATRLPELLRMVPGLNVARQDTAEWAISARGFNSRFANKLLVMIDGRSIYSPMFSGTLWEANDVVLEDIEKIEVIRGPGAATWGANAVNGVINIITKSTASTQGLLVAGVAGDEQTGGWARYGGAIGDDAHFRVYAKAHDHEPYTEKDGGVDKDEWSGQRAGFRSDWELAGGDSLVFQGDVYKEDPNDPDLRGYNLLGRWDRETASAHDTLQLYIDRSEIGATDPGHEILYTLDFDYSRELPKMDRHAVVFGLGYRHHDSSFQATNYSSIDPPDRRFDIFSLFLQDEIDILPDELILTVGAKVEHNDFSGLEFQPNVRMAWHPDAASTWWASVSRAVRTPSRGEYDLTVGTAVGSLLGRPVVNLLEGSQDFQSEEMTAYELGFRTQPSRHFNIDLALFYNEYDKLRSIETSPGLPRPDTLPFPSLFYIDSPLENQLYGDTYGFELALDLNPADWWRLQAAYSYLHMDLQKKPGSTDFILQSEENRTPRHQLSVHGAFDLGDRTEADVWAYYADELPGTEVSSYVKLDLRLAYRLQRNLSVELIGRNLLDPHHFEAASDPISAPPQQVDREFFVKMIWTN